MLNFKQQNNVCSYMQFLCGNYWNLEINQGYIKQRLYCDPNDVIANDIREQY